MNVYKGKSPKRPAKRSAKSSANQVRSDRAEVLRLRKKLAIVERQRDAYLHEIFRRMQAETAAMTLDLSDLREQFCKGPEIDLVAKLAARKRS